MHKHANSVLLFEMKAILYFCRGKMFITFLLFITGNPNYFHYLRLFDYQEYNLSYLKQL